MAQTGALPDRLSKMSQRGAVMAGSVEIVSDPDIQGGRFVFRGTRIPVGSIVHYAASAGRDETVAAWGHGLTGEMVDAALAFGWPPQRDAPAVDGEYVHLRCVCGEWTDDLAFGEPIECGYCGKRWRIDVEVVSLEGAGGG